MVRAMRIDHNSFSSGSGSIQVDLFQLSWPHFDHNTFTAVATPK